MKRHTFLSKLGLNISDQGLPNFLLIFELGEVV